MSKDSNFRELVLGCLVDAAKFGHLGIDFKVCRSTLAEANARRDSKYMREIGFLGKGSMAAFDKGYSDHEALGNKKHEARRVEYISSEDGKKFVFLTNNFKLKAVTIARIYRKRWKIELRAARFDGIRMASNGAGGSGENADKNAGKAEPGSGTAFAFRLGGLTFGICEKIPFSRIFSCFLN